MSGDRQRLIVFTRFPAAGRTKTRLIPALGAEGAAALHRRLVVRTVRTADALCRARGYELEIWFTGGEASAWRQWLGGEGCCRDQGEGDLGERLARAFAVSFQEGATVVVIIGTDCPGLTAGLLGRAFDGLRGNPVVFGPAADGGYYLVGMTRMVPELFRDVAWGTERVLGDSLGIVARVGLNAALLDRLEDIDRPEDLACWQRLAQAEESDLGCVSVIIPTLNEAGQITGTLAAVRTGAPHEVIVVDGGSRDDTRELAGAAGAIVLGSAPGRARQMNAGAARATGGVLLFLHADTRLPAGWRHVVSETLRRPGVVAGAFKLEIAEAFPGRWIVERTTHFRSRWLCRPYGDQGFFMRRSGFEELGGFAALPIMEDYEFVGRVRRRGQVVTTSEAAITSGRRWRQLGFIRATLINKIVVGGYRLGVAPERLARVYRQDRNPKGNGAFQHRKTGG